MRNSLGYTVLLKEPLKLAKFSFFAEKIVFWSNAEAPREKTVHLWELVIVLKVVVNNIVGIIHFDSNTLRSNLEELCEIKKINKYASLINFGCPRRENSAN